MLGLVIAFLAGGLIGICVGVWLVADNVRHSPDGCLVCGRPWNQTHAHGRAHIQLVEPATPGELELPHEN